jgi:hypothetical protein
VSRQPQYLASKILQYESAGFSSNAPLILKNSEGTSAEVDSRGPACEWDVTSSTFLNKSRD